MISRPWLRLLYCIRTSCSNCSILGSLEFVTTFFWQGRLTPDRRCSFGLNPAGKQLCPSCRGPCALVVGIGTFYLRRVSGAAKCDATRVAFVFRQRTLKFDSSVGLTKSRRSCSHRWSPAWQGSQQVDKCLGLGFEVRGVRGLGFIVMPEFECVEHICQNSLRCPLWLLQDQKGLHRKAVSFHQQ